MISESHRYELPETARKYALLISYVGTNFCGWQMQKGSGAEGDPSIQETIADAVHKLTGERVSIVGSGRTDAGVHALAQVAHFILKEKVWKTSILQLGLNSHLPTSIRVLEAHEVPLEFHAQRSAIRKQYSYYFQQGPCPMPQLKRTSWWIRKTLDVPAMQRALDHLKGEHDFKAFQARGAKPVPTVRELLETEITRVPLPFPLGAPDQLENVYLVRVRLVGTGFLKQMVRGIAGTLLQIGEGRREPDEMIEVLRAQDRKLVGPTAPGRGLWLERVWYPDFPPQSTAKTP